MQKWDFYTYKRNRAFLWNVMFSEVYIIVYLAYLADAILDIGVFYLDSNLHTCRYWWNRRDRILIWRIWGMGAGDAGSEDGFAGLGYWFEAVVDGWEAATLLPRRSLQFGWWICCRTLLHLTIAAADKLRVGLVNCYPRWSMDWKKNIFFLYV